MRLSTIKSVKRISTKPAVKVAILVIPTAPCGPLRIILPFFIPRLAASFILT